MKELLIKARNGDKAAEDELFQYLLVRFKFLGKRRVWEEADAEDIAQDACMTVLEKYKSSGHPEKFEAWAYKVLRNKIGNYLQSKAVREDKMMNGETINAEIGIKNNVVDYELREKFVGCFGKLIKTYPRYARVLNLINQGYDTREICTMLKIKPNNYYVILNRSRKVLRECMDKGENNV